MCLCRGQIDWPLSQGSDARWYLAGPKDERGGRFGVSQCSAAGSAGARIFSFLAASREASRSPFSSCAARADCWLPGFTSRHSRATHSFLRCHSAHALRFFVFSESLHRIFRFCHSLVVVPISFPKSTPFAVRDKLAPLIITTGP